MERKDFLDKELRNFAEQMDPEMIAQSLTPSKENVEKVIKDEKITVVNPETGEILEAIPIAEKENPNPAGDLLQKYTDLDLEISKVLIEQDEFMKNNKELFDKYEEFSKRIEDFREQQKETSEELKKVMRENNIPEEVGIRFKAKYTAPYTKKNFNTKLFYEDYAEDTAMYKKYVGISNVSDSIKITEVKKK